MRVCYADCYPTLNVTCEYISSPATTVYAANLELFTLRLDHSLDLFQFNKFLSANNLKDEGLQTQNGRRINICDGVCLLV